jgi:quercetin dioxygenase-like cupin family protein
LHITASELRAVMRHDVLLRSAHLGPVGAVLAELPQRGSRGTRLERPCDSAHWAIVLRGDLRLERGGERWDLPTGQAFYVPAGKPRHRFSSDGRAVVAGFVPLHDETRDAGGDVGLATRADGGTAPPGEIEAEAFGVGPWVMTRSTFGPTSGFGASWCDLPHWGIVVSGGGVIEYENDVEVIAAGDFYYCPPGPPGHKLEVADGAMFVDFTPRSAVGATSRVGEWRPIPPLLQRAR